MTERLKPCRFCGEMQPCLHDHAGKHFVYCPSCDAQGPPCRTKAEAVKLWNRAHDAQPEQPAAVPRELAVRLGEKHNIKFLAAMMTPPGQMDDDRTVTCSARFARKVAAALLEISTFASLPSPGATPQNVADLLVTAYEDGVDHALGMAADRFKDLAAAVQPFADAADGMKSIGMPDHAAVLRVSADYCLRSEEGGPLTFGHFWRLKAALDEARSAGLLEDPANG